MEVWVAPFTRTSCARGISRAISREWGGFHEISCPRKKKDRRLYRMQLFFVISGELQSRGGELLAAENMRIDHVSKCMPFFSADGKLVSPHGADVFCERKHVRKSVDKIR